jgi:hypothetical protein
MIKRFLKDQSNQHYKDTTRTGLNAVYQVETLAPDFPAFAICCLHANNDEIFLSWY